MEFCAHTCSGSGGSRLRRGLGLIARDVQLLREFLELDLETANRDMFVRVRTPQDIAKRVARICTLRTRTLTCLRVRWSTQTSIHCLIPACHSKDILFVVGLQPGLVGGEFCVLRHLGIQLGPDVALWHSGHGVLEPLLQRLDLNLGLRRIADVPQPSSSVFSVIHWRGRVHTCSQTGSCRSAEVIRTYRAHTGRILAMTRRVHMCSHPTNCSSDRTREHMPQKRINTCSSSDWTAGSGTGTWTSIGFCAACSASALAASCRLSSVFSPASASY